VVLLLATVLLAACGGGGDETTEAEATDASIVGDHLFRVGMATSAGLDECAVRVL
jgi:hypothetical protein